MLVTLRDYQRECVDIIDSLEGGSHLVHMATGLGKTVVFTSIERRGRVLILSHRDELVRQPIKFYDVPVGIEKADERSSGEEVVCATVQTLSRDKRLSSFEPGTFDTIITDEAHHALAPSYRKIVEALQPRLHVGFTATPRRGDDRGLEKVFDDIVFSRDLKWGIKKGWLADVDCIRVTIDWDTAGLHRQNGDYKISELDAEINRPVVNAQVAEAYERYAKGQTLVFSSSVPHAHQLASMIEGAAVVDGSMPGDERRAVLDAFRSGEIRCLVNYGVFTEGTDLPMIETVLLARPTQNPSLYTQMVGRGLRLDPEHGKDSVRLIDCVGVTRDNRLCTAPTLFGLNESDFPDYAGNVVNGSLLGLEDRLAEIEDSPRAWVLHASRCDLFAGPVAWITLADGRRQVSGPAFSVVKGRPNDLGEVTVEFRGMRFSRRTFPSEESADVRVRDWLERNPLTRDVGYLWDPDLVSNWGSRPASQKQVNYARSLLGEEASELDDHVLTMREATIVIENAKQRELRAKAELYGRCPICGSPLSLSRSGKSVQCSSIRWRKTEFGSCIPEGPCIFRFSRCYDGRRLSDRQVKRLSTDGEVPFSGRTLRLYKDLANEGAFYLSDKENTAQALEPFKY